MARMQRNAMFEQIGETVDAARLVDGLPEKFVFDVRMEPLHYMDNGELKRLDGKSTVINCVTGRAYGPVSDKYRPIPNLEALGSVGYMKDLSLRKFGETKGGTQWLIGELPHRKILGDTFAPYVVFRNSFNGNSQIQMAMAPLRIVCQNQISMALRTSNYSYSIKHTKNASAQIEEAACMIRNANSFMNDLEKQAETFALTKVSQSELEGIIEQMFPVNENMSELQSSREMARRMAFAEALREPDLANFKGSAWAIINAYSDVITHYQPVRTTETAKENSFLTVTFDPRWMMALVNAINHR